MQVTFATYNVAKFGMGPKDEALGPAAQHVAATVAEVDADVLALQEVPSAKALEAFCAGLPEGEYPHRAFFPTNDPRGHHMAVLSRHPLGETSAHRPSEFVRGVGEAEVQIGPYPCRVYTTHLKADPFYGKPFTEADVAKAQARRASELSVLQGLVAEDLPAMPARRYVVAGDMNAAPSAPEMRGLVEGGLLSDPLAGSAACSHPPTGVRRDYLLAGPGVEVVSSRVHDTETARKASDHLPVVLTIDVG